MKLFVEFDYNFRGVVDGTPAEMDVFLRVLDRMKTAENWYSHTDVVQLVDTKTPARYRAAVVPATVPVLPVPAPQDPQNGAGTA